jgi:Protein of unknown function (DUF2029).
MTAMRQFSKKHFGCIAAFCTLIAFGILSILLRQDANYDLKNYHYYNAYAWLTDRYHQDVLPAQFDQTYFNPLLDVPIYFLQRHVPPRLAGFILGFVQGLNVLLVYQLARRILPAGPSTLHRALPVLATAVGATTPVFLSELGTDFGDNLTSLPILGGLLLVIIDLQAGRVGWRSLIGGLCFGLAVGVKLTNAPYGVALIAAVAVATPLRRTVMAVLATGAAAAAGFAATAGYWLLFLYRAFGNPLFPYYNGVFHSPYAQPFDQRDMRWIAHGLADVVRYPFAWFVGLQPPSMELRFRDPRWLLIIALFVAVAATRLWGWVRSRRSRGEATTVAAAAAPEWQRSATLFVVFAVVAYSVWLYQFSYSRYLVPIDLTTGILLWLLVLLLPLRRRQVTVLGLVLSLVAFSSLIKYPNWGRAPWSDSWFDVRLDRLPNPDRAQVLMVSKEPLAYVIPAFPPQVRFLRVDGWGWSKNTGKFEERVAAAVAAHDGSFYALAVSPAEVAAAAPVLATYGLVPGDPAACLPLPTKFSTLLLCPLHRR